MPASLAAPEFVRKWAGGSTAARMNERQGAQAHFLDLCSVLEVPGPDDPDTYTFERGFRRAGGTGQAFADVWKRGCFAWEYKAPGKSLEGALKQLMMYALPLENPPLLVVSDRQHIEMHTHFTGTPSECHRFALEEIVDPAVRQSLRRAWTEPDAFKPKRSNREITDEAARTFADTAVRLRAASVPAPKVSHFLTQCVFSFFAEDVGLLPGRLFERLMSAHLPPERLRTQLRSLFETMREGGLFGVDDVPWFNGGLFATIDVPALAGEDVAALKAASRLDWSAIEPSIFGTLFERGLDPAKRSQLGAHYTDPATILRLVEPVVQRPLLAEWADCRSQIADAMAKSKRQDDKPWRAALAVFTTFLERLAAFRVLDPACGSGNFLFLALKCLKDIEHQVNLEAEALGLPRQHDVTGPHNVLGIEINEYAAELARVTVWIGELQWRLQRGYGFKTRPVLEPLDHIECRDAVLGADGAAACWPAAEAVVGNPPFVGNKKMRGELGDEYTERLRAAFEGKVPGEADLVCFWFERARAEIAAGRLRRAGLVATNSIRGGANREVLDAITSEASIFEAWSDEPWVNDGAALRVSLLAFGDSPGRAMLDGKPVNIIAADLTGSGRAGAVDLTVSKALAENAASCFMGVTKVGPFDIAGQLARLWLKQPNPGGRSNAEVLRRSWNGLDAVRRDRDVWIVDFGTVLDQPASSMFEAPFEYALREIKGFRATNNREAYRVNWWRHGEARPGLRRLLAPLPRFIVTPEVAKHRVFLWAPAAVLPDKNLQVTPRSDDSTFGVLHSRFHELWSLRMCTWMGKGNDPRYTPTTCFETFPFPAGLTPADTAHQRTEAIDGGQVLIPAGLAPDARTRAEPIARAAVRLVALRDAWLNPPEWTERVPEVVPLGMKTSPYPDRIVAKSGHEAELAKRTLTNLYNQRPAWLSQAHEALDAAVAAAYGWTDYTADMSDEEVLRRLLAENQQRAQHERSAQRQLPLMTLLPGGHEAAHSERKPAKRAKVETASAPPGAVPARGRRSTGT